MPGAPVVLQLYDETVVPETWAIRSTLPSSVASCSTPGYSTTPLLLSRTYMGKYGNEFRLGPDELPVVGSGVEPAERRPATRAHRG